jgi:ribosome-associated toxin RatA of RatAB toxin-antitoxin module
MTVLRKLLLALIILVAALLLTGFLLPARVSFERSALVRAPAPVIFSLVDGYQRFNEYSPWFDADPKARFTLSGPQHGVGAKLAWASDNPAVGTGTQQIVASEPDRMVRATLEFGQPGAAQASWRIEPAPDGENCRVSWMFEIDFGINPVSRWMGIFVERLVAPDYELGLRKLKALAEKEPKQVPAAAQTAIAAPPVE